MADCIVCELKSVLLAFKAFYMKMKMNINIINYFKNNTIKNVI